VGIQYRTPSKRDKDATVDVRQAKFDYDKYGEAMDTVVREMVYDAIGASKRGEDFYV
jgi:hypothetical protein